MRPNRLASNLTKGLMLFLLLATGLSGCLFFGGRDAQETSSEEQIATGPTDLENTATGVRITVPDGWRVAREGLRKTADIYAVYPSRDLYAAVLSERAAVLSQFDLEDNATQYRRLIRSELDDYEGEDRLGTSSIDGKPAIQYEIRGRVDGVPVVYLHTTVKGADNYYQVVGWTTENGYEENEETLKAIALSFRKTES